MSIIISKNNFQAKVLNASGPVLLDFWAPWCGPCRMVGPILEEIAAERPDIKVGKVNVDKQPVRHYENPHSGSDEKRQGSRSNRGRKAEGSDRCLAVRRDADGIV